MAASQEESQEASFPVEAYQAAYRALEAFQAAFLVASPVENLAASCPEEILEAFLKIISCKGNKARVFLSDYLTF